MPKRKPDAPDAPETSKKPRTEVLPGDLRVRSDADEELTLADLYAHHGIVILAYPRANTSGCTTQACGFRDLNDQFTALGFKLYGLSTDSPKTLANWKKSKSLPYTLLSDPKQDLHRALGCAKGNGTQRSHFVIEKGGKLLHAVRPVKPKESPRLALEYVEGLDSCS